MPLHLLKLAVGIDDIDHLRQIRRVRAAERGGNWVLYQEPTPTGARGSCGWIDLLGHPRSDPGPTTRYRAARRTRRNGSPLLSDRGRCGAGAHTPAGVAAVSGLAISGIGGRAARSVGTCGGALGPDVRGTACSRSDLKRGVIFGDNPLDITGYDDYVNRSLRSSRAVCRTLLCSVDVGMWEGL